MRSSTKSARILIPALFSVLAFFSLAAAQTAPSLNAPAKPAAKTAEKSAANDASTVLPSEATVDSFLHATFGYDPQLTWKISSIVPAPVPGLAEVSVVLASPQGQQLSRFFVTADGAHALTGDIIPFGAQPFTPARRALEKGITGPSRGPKDAPATIVEFGDLQCPACKAAQPAIEALMAAEPNARLVFQNFPLEMHNWAAKGAAYADCVGRASNEAFWKFVAKTYETQADITAENADEKLTAIADGAGVKGTDIAACAAAPDTKARVDASVAFGKSMEVTSTPTLFINGRRIGNVSNIPAEVLKQLVEFAAKQ
ncbi:MAG: thioredoxin domain-containing protein [Candidatus Sulfotelmatobacter sp.]|jgi:protein-disulfide isomerase